MSSPTDGFCGAWSSEMRRLRTWPAVWAVIGAWVVLSFLFAYVFPYLTFRTGSSDFADSGVARHVLGLQMSPAHAPEVAIEAMPLFGGAMMTVLGVLLTGSGYTWKFWKTAATQAVSRRTLMAGSLTAATSAAALLVIFEQLLCLGASLTIASAENLDTRMPAWSSWATSGGVGFLVMETWVLIGCALGVASRGTGLPLGLALVWTLVVENLLRGVSLLLPWMTYLTDVLPGTASGSLVGAVNGSPLGEVTPGILTDISGDRALITVVLYAALAATIGHELFARRDLT